MKKWISLFVWCAVSASVIWLVIDRLPPQHNPFTHIAIDHPIGFATGFKLARMSTDRQQCIDFLDESDIEYTRLDDGDPEEACGFRNAVTLDQSDFPYSATLSMSCPLTSGLAIWERQSLGPIAEEFFGEVPVEIRTFGSYSCRRIYGRQTGRYSEHATGNAVDIEGFLFADGRTITLLEHWDNGEEEGEFLQALRDDACQVFGTVLGPEYNDAHANHFHFDMSQTGICS